MKISGKHEDGLPATPPVAEREDDTQEDIVNLITPSLENGQSEDALKRTGDSPTTLPTSKAAKSETQPVPPPHPSPVPGAPPVLSDCVKDLEVVSLLDRPSGTQATRTALLVATLSAAGSDRPVKSPRRPSGSQKVQEKHQALAKEGEEA
jgi:hypothetical protein